MFAKCSWGQDPSVRAGVWRVVTLVLAVATALILLGPSIVGKMLDKTHGIGWDTPEDSISVLAGRRAQELFPNRMRGAVIMAVEAKPGIPTVLTEVVENFSRNVSRRVASDVRVQLFKPIVVGYYIDLPGGHHLGSSLQAELVSADQRMTVIIIQPTTMDGDFEDANSFLNEFCGHTPPGFKLHITGMLSVLTGDGCFDGVHGKVDTRNLNFEIIVRTELCTIPIALLIMSYMVHYVRLLVLPLFTVVLSFVVSAALVVPFMDVVPVPNDVPAAMGSVTLALCLDYSLFFLSRFGEQHKKGWPLQQNVDTLLSCTARTIAVSGTLIAIAFFASMVLPQRNLQGTGLCMGIVTVSAVITSVTLTPAMILAGGRLLVGHEFKNPFIEIEMDTINAIEQMTEMVDPCIIHREESLWLRAIRQVDHAPVAAVCLVLFVMSPLIFCLPQLNISGDRFALLPMYMPAMVAMRHVQKSFPVGILDPYAIVITSPMQAGNLNISDELAFGMKAVEKHDLLSVAEGLGFTTAETASVAKVWTATFQGRAADGATLESDLAAMIANCRIVTSVGAGAVTAIEKARGAADGDALVAAVRVIMETGCPADDIQDAIAGAATLLHASGSSGNEMAKAVKREASRLGVGEELADDLAMGAAQGVAGHFKQTNLIGVKAGAAVGVYGRPAVRGIEEAPKSDMRAEDAWIRGLVLSSADIAQLMRVARVSRERGLDAAFSSEEMHKVRLGAAGIFASAMVGAFGVRGTENSSLAFPGDVVYMTTTSADGGVAAAGLNTAPITGALDEGLQEQLSLIMEVVSIVRKLSDKRHGLLLMPSGYGAMLDLCNAVLGVGSVSSMVGPSWALHRAVDWVSVVAMHVDPAMHDIASLVYDSYVRDNVALLEVHTTFPSIGAHSADWVVATRKALQAWEASHPGYQAELSGGNSETVDIRDAVMKGMWTYLGWTISLIVAVVLLTFRSFMIPVRLAFALLFTLAATYGTGVLIYQTPLLHRVFPCLEPFHGLAYEVVPLVTGVTIALGLDYDIYLVNRIVEFRKLGFTDRASVYRGSAKAGGVISGAGLIMVLSFSGLLFSDKLLMQQFGLLIITSVIFDTFVVRTILVPALMLIAQDWNWWPRRMPLGIHDSLEGEVDTSEGGLYRPMAG